MVDLVKKKKSCKYCKDEINSDASLCNHCGQSQSGFLYFINYFGLIPNLISVLLLIVAIIQTNLANEEQINAESANNNAQKALLKITEAEKRIKETKKDILIISKSIIKISEILPRSTGYGSGLSLSDEMILKENINVIKKISDKTNDK